MSFVLNQIKSKHCAKFSAYANLTSIKNNFPRI